MSLILNDEIINKEILIIYQYYKNAIDPDIPDIKVVASDNIKEDSELLYGYKNDCTPNGVYIYPNKRNKLKEPLCIIKYESFYKNGFPYVTTVMHELVHASDFEKFKKQFCKNKWSKIKSHKYYKTFHLWSEFHAKLVSIYHTRILLSILSPSNFPLDEALIKDEYTNQHLPVIKNNLIQSLNNKFRLVDLFYYLGGFMACEKFNPELNLAEHTPSELIDYFPSVNYLYLDLMMIQDYEKASLDFDYLSAALKPYLNPYRSLFDKLIHFRS